VVCFKRKIFANFLGNFTLVWQCILTNFFIIKPNRCTNFTNLFWNETLHVSDSFRAGPGWNWFYSVVAVYKPAWHKPLLSVQWINSWWWIEELFETCRVSFQNKFVKLVHLGGFIIKKNIISVHAKKAMTTLILKYNLLSSFVKYKTMFSL
jgi:hypothetical protein